MKQQHNELSQITYKVSNKCEQYCKQTNHMLTVLLTFAYIYKLTYYAWLKLLDY